MKKIAFIMPFKTIGGAEIQSCRLAREAKKRGYFVGMFMVSNISPKNASIDISWADETFEQKYNFFQGYSIDDDLIEKLSSYPVIHLTNIHRDQRVALKSRLKAKFLETWHGEQDIEAYFPGNTGPIDTAEVRFCVTSRLTQIVKKLSTGTTEHIHNPVDIPNEFCSLEGNVVAMVGKINHNKNQREFVRILRDIDDVRGLLIGGADPFFIDKYERIIDNMARKNNLDIRVTGFISDAQVGEALLQSDVMLHTSNVDNQPLSILEAMAAGLPVVAKAVGGIPEMIANGCDGYLYDDMAEGRALVEMLLTDKLHARKIGSAARKKIIENHSIEKCFDSYARFI